MGSFAYVGGDHAVLDSSAYQGGGFGKFTLPSYIIIIILNSFTHSNFN